eukprot:9088587-Alexandrium_andersonii.AAC.1
MARSNDPSYKWLNDELLTELNAKLEAMRTLTGFQRSFISGQLSDLKAQYSEDQLAMQAESMVEE